VEIWQIYGFEGELLAEYAANSVRILPQKEYGYQGGKLLITANGGDDNRFRRFVENLYYRTWGYLPAGKGQSLINELVTALGTAGQNNQAAMLQTAKDQAAGLFDAWQYTSRNTTHEQYVADLYLAYLQRPPESAAAINWWAGFLYNGQLTRLQLRNEFANGPEFAWIVNSLYGEQSGDYDRVDRFASQTYLAATGVLPNSTQSANERGRFDVAEAQGLNDVKEAAKALGRDLLGANVGYRSDLSTPEYVTRLYETFLRRAPDGNAGNWQTQADQQGRSYVLEQFLAMSAYSERSGALYREIFWLVSDHLGTPRMIAERTGKLEGIKRSDYLPFGEEIESGTGGRTTAQGYGGQDSIRQKFTGYERDAETDLDFAQARVYANKLGRFTSTDPLFIKEDRLRDPQQVNLYVYVRNNPLAFVDPTGLDFEFTGKDKDKFVTDVNNREKAQFKVKLNDKGIVEVVDKGKVDVSKLTKSEAAMFNAINDKDNRATLNGIGKDAGIDFGGFKGNGTNDIDTSDMALLRDADKTLAGNVISHEMMEAYASAKGACGNYDSCHNEANKTFPGMTPTDANQLPNEENSQFLTGAVVDYATVGGKSKSIVVTYQFEKKMEAGTFNSLPRGHITKVKVKTP
jgi:RHS repeat-associated protein